jgi:hypothetical protein
MEAGFPHLKQMARLPEALMPDFAKVARQLGDETMLEIVEPLGLTERLKTLLAEAPDPDMVPVEIWQQSIANWPPVQQVLSATMALLHACEKVEALERQGVLKIDSALIRGLAVTTYAPFAPNGSELLSRLADILGGSLAEPVGLLGRYILAIMVGDTDTLADVDRYILENPVWREWSERFLAIGKGFPFVPRVIGIRPPLTKVLKQALVNMMMEVLNADHSRNYPS